MNLFELVVLSLPADIWDWSRLVSFSMHASSVYCLNTVFSLQKLWKELDPTLLIVTKYRSKKRSYRRLVPKDYNDDLIFVRDIKVCSKSKVNSSCNYEAGVHGMEIRYRGTFFLTDLVNGIKNVYHGFYRCNRELVLARPPLKIWKHYTVSSS